MRQRHSRDERWCFVVRQTDQPQTVGVLTSRHKEAWMFLSCTAWPVRYVTIRFFEHVEALCLSNICFYGVDMLGLYRTIEDMSKKSSKYEIRFLRLNSIENIHITYMLIYFTTSWKLNWNINFAHFIKFLCVGFDYEMTFNWFYQIKVEMKFAKISDLELISSMDDESFLTKITDLVLI